MMTGDKNILLYDGVCILCSKLVSFISKRDSKAGFSYVSLQSNYGQTLLQGLGLPTDDFDSVVYISNDKYWLKSAAILHILKALGGIWSLTFIFIIIPRFLRDFIYDIVVRIRYHIFGKKT
jgi:predicted DCC family thiol-disulfide oxidoreductase YuxK